LVRDKEKSSSANGGLSSRMIAKPTITDIEVVIFNKNGVVG
jgi:hypothetical protein